MTTKSTLNAAPHTSRVVGAVWMQAARHVRAALRHMLRSAVQAQPRVALLGTARWYPFKLVCHMLLSALLCGAASAHTFFEGLVSIDVNPRSQQLEIVHSYTAHDLTALLMEQTQLAINLEHPEHEALLRDYIEQHFVLRSKGNRLSLSWVGIRITPQTVEIYQELRTPPPLNTIEVQHDVLRSRLVNQVNRVNYSQGACRASLVFDRDTAKRQAIAAPCLTH